MIDGIDNRAHFAALPNTSNEFAKEARAQPNPWTAPGPAMGTILPARQLGTCPGWASETYVFAQNWRMDQDLLPASIEYNQV